MKINEIKKEFPIFKKKINNKSLVYLDSANSSQKPKSVINRMSYFYENEFSNVGRSVHSLAVTATNRFEETRDLVKKFIKPSCEFFDVSLLFAPIKLARLDYFAQKTCEMGVKTLWPIYTEYTQSKKFNSKRFKANLIEAAEQCDFNNIPEIREPENFKNILTNWDNLLGDNQVIFCDEKSTINAFDLLQNQKCERSEERRVGKECER